MLLVWNSGITTLNSDTKLNDLVKRPQIVEDLDWIDILWPIDISVPAYPKVQVYCLMGVEHSYTDFHIDFGGTSVFYHVLDGEKIFYLIEPTEINLSIYKKWSNSLNQKGIWF
jgi:hypothetical protein